jgi:hypothetical protein
MVMVPLPAVLIALPEDRKTPLLDPPVAVVPAVPVREIDPVPALMAAKLRMPNVLLPVPAPTPFSVMLPVPVLVMSAVWLMPLFCVPLELPPVPVIEIAPPPPARRPPALTP